MAVYSAQRQRPSHTIETKTSSQLLPIIFCWKKLIDNQLFFLFGTQVYKILVVYDYLYTIPFPIYTIVAVLEICLIIEKVLPYTHCFLFFYYLGIKKRLKFRWQYLGQILINFKKLYEVWNHKKIIFNLRGVAAR